MADLADVCLFSGVAMDTCLEDTLADDDFLKFLQDTDLTGALPLIPDVYQPADAAGFLDVSGTAVSGSAGYPTAVVTTVSPMMAPVAGLYPVSVRHAVHPLAAEVEVTVSPQASLLPQPLVQQPQACRTFSSSSSDVSAAAAGLVAVSAPGSPVSSNPTCSSDTSGHQAVDKSRRSSSTSQHHSQQRLSSTGTAAATSQQSQPLQPQKPLTKQQIAANKRRAPEVDWRSIDDPAERRRQRRLAKNRVTAARSRERKKEQMVEMEDRMAALEQENSQMRALLASLAQENTSLKEQLASLTRGAGTANNTRGSPEPAVLKCLAIMHLVCYLLVVKASFVLVGYLVSAMARQVAWSGRSSAAVFSSPCIVISASDSNSRCAGSLWGGVDCWQGTRARLKPESCAA